MISSKILTQSLALFFTIYIFLIWNFHKKTNSDNEIIFVFAFIASMLTEILDIAVQVVSSDYLIVFNDSFTRIVIKTYLVTVPLSISVIMLYANFSILNAKQFRIFRIIVLTSAFINSIIIWFLPASVEIRDTCNIPVGLSVQFTYLISSIISFALLIELFLSRKKINIATYAANTIWLLLCIFGGIVQYVFLDSIGTPIASFIISVGGIALYLILENPGNKYDYNKNCFHYETFVKYITETIRFEEIQSILFLNVSTSNNENLKYITDVFDSIIEENANNDELKIFKGVGNELIVTSKEFITIQDVASTVYGHVNDIEQKYNISINASVVLIPSIKGINNYYLLRNIFDDYRIKGNMINDNVQYFTINEKVIKKYNKEAEITSDIDYAIKNNTIDIRFQSLNSLIGTDKQIYEIITALTNEKGEILFPSDYSHVANKNDKFLQIDEQSFEKVCIILEQILCQRNKLGYVLVRTSVQAIEQEQFLDRTIELMRKYDIPYKNICFEITNANAILKKDILLKNITYMQKLGMSFAMGGFGSGESNLNYFIDLPMNIVKFDQSILKNAIEDPKAAMIMRDVTELAHSLGFKVIAVGAKNDKEIDFIKECGVEMVIGDRLSDVISVEEFIRNVSFGGAE